jgi:hypothetical protein
MLEQSNVGMMEWWKRNIGIMEYWKNGMMGSAQNSNIPLFQFPAFQSSSVMIVRGKMYG